MMERKIDKQTGSWSRQLMQRISSNKKPWIVGAAVASFAVLGLILMNLSSAATNAVAVEAESGTRAGNTAPGTTGGASGGASVKFGAAATNPNPTPTPPTPPNGNFKPGFVYRQGRNLMLDGQVYKAAGVNNFWLTGCHHGQYPSQGEVDSFFGSLRPKSMTRVWAFKMQGEQNITKVVAAAEKYNQKVIFTLADGAEYCGSPDFDGGFYSSGFKGEYFNWISTIVPKYKDSPAIGAWEIMNEPALKADSNQSTMKSFFDQTAAHIKSKDPNHLVSTGTLAPWQGEFEGASGYANVHSGPNIDIISLHEYDYAYESSRTIISPHYGPTKQAAEQVQKPIIVGEVGISLASGCMSQQERANAYKQKLDAYLSQGASAVFYWSVLGTPNNGGNACNSQYGNNDPLSGPLMDMIKNYQMP